MKRKLGAFFLFLGFVSILCAAGLYLYNREQSDESVQFSAEVVPVLTAQIQRNQAQSTQKPDAAQTTPLPIPEPDREMTVCEIDGYSYIGILSIPAINYTSQIMADWSYRLLNVSACRFSGSTFGNDLVLCAHNYDGLHRSFVKLPLGSEVLFTDMDGVVWRYTVAALETLEDDQVEEMTESGFPLTFFTCTYGGKTRLTLRCVSADFE